MRRFHYIVLVSLLMFLIISCSDMNDMHDSYLKNGETTYVGRVDSIHVFSGKERVKISYWLKDPRVKDLHVFWNNKNDSIIVPVPSHNPLDSMAVTIDPISEGDYTFFFYSHDGRGHRSINFEAFINVYGARYQATLSNRSVKKVTKVENSGLILEWGGINNIDETGVELLFKTTEGEEQSLFIPSEGLSIPTVLENVDYRAGVNYRTWYKPTPNAIDSFNAPLTTIL